MAVNSIYEMAGRSTYWCINIYGKVNMETRLYAVFEFHGAILQPGIGELGLLRLAGDLIVDIDLGRRIREPCRKFGVRRGYLDKNHSRRVRRFDRKLAEIGIRHLFTQ